MRSRIAKLVALVAAGGLLAGCVGIPTSGGVEAGPEFGQTVPGDIVYDPSEPEPGADPLRILEGFIDAFTGTQGDYEVARMFLTEDFRAEWEPRKSVLVRAGSETFRVIDETTLEYAFTTTAQLDESGAYTPTVPALQSLTYRFAQENGEWRISEAPPGIVLAQSTFRSIFRPHSLYFFDLSLQRLVPDQRWFPGGTTATRIVTALLRGVPEWLEGAAVSQFPDGTMLTPGTVVTVESAIAQVDLTAEAATASDRQRQLMRLQLTESLRSVSGIGNVEVSIAGAPLGAAPLGSDAPVVDPRVDARPLVLADGRFGYMAGDEVTELGELSDRILEIGPTSVTLAALGTNAAVQDGDGVSWMVRTGGARPVDVRPGLAPPSLDDFGYLWSVPASDPRGLVVFDFDGNGFPVETGLSGEGTVRSINVSRDGARVAVLLDTVTGYRLIVAGIVRDPARGYVPVALGTPGVDVIVPAANAIDATWVGETSVAALVEQDGQFEVTLYEIGGIATSLGRPDAAVAIVGGNGRAGLRVLGADGTVSVPRGSSWQRTSVVVDLIATQR